MLGKTLFQLIQETTAFAFIIKIFTFKNGSGLILSSFLSFFITISTSELFTAVLKNTEVKNLVLPIFVEVGGFTLYFLFNIADFGAGIWFAISNAEKTKTNGFFEKDKLYKTLWKMLGVLLLTILIMFISILSEIIGASYSYKFFVFALALVLTLACLYEFRSIGKNIEKRTGSKPDIFFFMDKILNAIQRRTLKEIDRTNIIGEEKEGFQEEENSEIIEETEQSK